MKTILVATADDNEPENTLVEAQDELDTRDYGEYKQEPIQLRRSKPEAADVVPNTDKHPLTPTSKLFKRRQVRRTDTLKRPRRTGHQRIGIWVQRNLLYMGSGCSSRCSCG